MRKRLAWLLTAAVGLWAYVPMPRVYLPVLLALLPSQARAFSSSSQATHNCSSLNQATYTTASFTPAVGDLLVVFATASATQDAGDMTGSAGVTAFTQITTANYATNVNRIYAFVGNTIATATAQTVTLDVTGDDATGACIGVIQVARVPRAGANAIIRSSREQNQAATGTPAPAFAAATRAQSTTLGVVGNNSNVAGLTPPTDWNELGDSGFANPTTGQEFVARDGGFVGTTITWGGTSATVFGDIIVEVDTSCAAFLSLLGVGCQ